MQKGLGIVEENKFKIGQRVFIKEQPETVFVIEEITKWGGEVAFKGKDEFGRGFLALADEIGNAEYKPKEDEPIEKQVEHIIEEQDQQEERQVLEQYLQESTSLTANQYIALELVKAWGSQQGQPAQFESFLDNYFIALEQLKEVQNQAIDGENN